MALKDIVSRLPLIPFRDLKATGSSPDNLRLGDDLPINLSYLVVFTQDGPKIVGGGKIGATALPNDQPQAAINTRVVTTFSPYEVFPAGVHNHNDVSALLPSLDFNSFALFLNITAVPGDGSQLGIVLENQNPFTGTWHADRIFANTRFTAVTPVSTVNTSQDRTSQVGGSFYVTPASRFRVDILAPSSPFTFELGGYIMW